MQILGVPKYLKSTVGEGVTWKAHWRLVWAMTVATPTFLPYRSTA